jgi:hypothetical protein
MCVGMANLDRNIVRDIPSEHEIDSELDSTQDERQKTLASRRNEIFLQFVLDDE